MRERETQEKCPKKERGATTTGEGNEIRSELRRFQKGQRWCGVRVSWAGHGRVVLAIYCARARDLSSTKANDFAPGFATTFSSTQCRGSTSEA
jgi:hypothetical protein